MENVEYANCPLCYSKKITHKQRKVPDGSGIAVTVLCDDCGNTIDRYRLVDGDRAM